MGYKLAEDVVERIVHLWERDRKEYSVPPNSEAHREAGQVEGAEEGDLRIHEIIGCTNSFERRDVQLSVNLNDITSIRSQEVSNAFDRSTGGVP